MTEPPQLNPVALALLTEIRDGVRRLDVGMGVASPDARAVMDKAPYLPSRAEMRAAYAAASPDVLVEMAADLAEVADLGVLARVTALMCTRTSAAYEDAETQTARLRVLPPAGGERLPA